MNRAYHGAGDELRAVAARQRGLRVLLLHGSRARADATARSDWDFGYLADERFDEAGLRAALARALDRDDVDLVDLRRAGGLVRVRAAREGRCLYERRPGEADHFRLQAVRFWLDVEHVVRPEYQGVLRGLG